MPHRLRNAARRLREATGTGRNGRMGGVGKKAHVGAPPAVVRPGAPRWSLLYGVVTSC